jgi:hypothetical protein
VTQTKIILSLLSDQLSVRASLGLLSV